MLMALADRLGVELLDLVTFPEGSERHELIDLTPRMKPGTIRRLLRDARG
jgi:hypothetical protein